MMFKTFLVKEKILPASTFFCEFLDQDTVARAATELPKPSDLASANLVVFGQPLMEISS